MYELRGFTTRVWVALGMMAICVSVLAPTAHATVVFGQIDTFQDGSTMAWAQGGISPNPPSNVATGGPAGVGDRFIQNPSNGSTGAGGRQIMFNQSQWTGDYVTAGVTRLNAMVRNAGATDLYLRVAVEGSFFERYGSTTAIHVPAGSGWQSVSFDLTPAAMTHLSGTDSLATVLSNVGELRLLSNQAAADWIGERKVALMQVDNITAAPEPGSLALVLLGAAALLRRRA